MELRTNVVKEPFRFFVKKKGEWQAAPMQVWAESESAALCKVMNYDTAVKVPDWCDTVEKERAYVQELKKRDQHRTEPE